MILLRGWFLIKGCLQTIPLYSIAYDKQVSTNILNADLKFIEKWAYQWKMQFKPDKNKQAIQVLSQTEKANRFILP